MKVKLILLAMAALSVFASCGGKEKPIDEPTNPAPVLLSVNPSNGAEITATSVTFTLTFDQTVKAPSTGISSIAVSPKADVSRLFSSGSEVSLSLENLQDASDYSVRIPSGVISGFKANQDAVGDIVLTFSVKLPVDPGEVDPSDCDNDATALSARLGLGWNMGNHFDAYYNGSWAGSKEGYPDEEVWGNAKATAATFAKIKAAGFTSVRIPVSWLKMIGDAPDYTIDATWLDRVYEVALWAHEAGLDVIVNTHHDENHGVSNTYQWLDIKNAATNAALKAQINEEIAAVWTQIATRFRDCGDWLILEGFNELNDGGWGWSSQFTADPTKQCGVLNDWNRIFVDAVRATGGNNATRWLGVPTYAANPAFAKYLELPQDPAGKIMVSVHFYDPSSYTIGDEQYTDWGHTGASGKKADWGDENHVKAVFGELFSKYIAENIPVYIGEFGCSMRSKSDARAWKFYLYYLEYVVKAAKTYGLSCFLWDNGASGDGKEHHGYFNHGTGDYIGNSKEAVDVMVKARFTTDASYTLDSVYKSAPTF